LVRHAMIALAGPPDRHDLAKEGAFNL
jgi:hypothetical protein